MKTWIWIPVALIAFSVGLGLGLVIGDAAPESNAIPLLAGQQPVSESPTEAQTEGELRVRPPQVDVEVASQAQPQSRIGESADENQLMAALQAISTRREPTGRLSITGTVFDENGQPVPGVAVRGVLHQPNSSRGASADRARHRVASFWPDVASEVEALVRERHMEAGGHNVQVTGADGRFRIEGLADAEYVVIGELKGYRITPFAGFNRVRSGGVADLLASRSTRVVVRAVNENGEPESAFSVNVFRLGANVTPEPPVGTSTVQHVFDLTPGRYYVDGGRSDPAASAIRQKLHVTGQDSEVLVTLRLVSLSGIRVRARLQGGSLLRGAGIRVAAIHPGESGQDVARRLPSPLQVPVLSQNPGFHEVPPGRYLASLVSGSHVVHSEEVNHQGGLTTLEWTIQPPDPAECIVCRVDSASPQRSGGLSFRVVGSSTPGVSVELDGWNLGSGEFRLYLPETSDKFVPSGIVAEGYDLRPATAPLTQLRPQSVSLKFQATGHLIVELTGGDLRGIRPMLELKDDAGRHVGSATNHSAVPRVFVVRGVPAGKVHLRVIVWNGGEIPLATVPLIANGETQEITVELPVFHEVSVRMNTAGSSHVSVDGVAPAGRFRLSVYVTPRGSTTLFLPAGTHKLTYRVNDVDREISVSVPNQRMISLPD